MKIRIPFIAGAAIGYVLGTKAGRERYEQIMQQSRKFAENPKVQEKAEALRAKSGELAGTARQKADEAKTKMGAKRHGEQGGAEAEPLPTGATATTEGRFSETATGARTGTGAPTTAPTPPAGSGAPTGSRRPR